MNGQIQLKYPSKTMEVCKCIICERNFAKLKKENGKRNIGARGTVLRNRRSITCSKICSKTYTRILGRINNIKNRKVKQGDEQWE